MDIDSILDLLGLDGDIDIDIPDDVYVPDDSTGLDVDAIDSDYAPEAYTDLSDQYNVSFGAQNETLRRSGGGLGSLDVTITKEPGSSSLFCITDGTTTIHNVPRGQNSIKIDGIKYILPKLKG